MIRKYCLILVVLIALLPMACGSVVSKQIKKEAESAPAFIQVSENPNEYKGQAVVWGGEIVNTETQDDGSTIIEVFERPLGSRDAPDIGKSSEGRFLIRSDRFLDPYIYASGKKITVGGAIMGEEIRPIGKMNYSYPVVLSKELHLWKESYYYPPSNYYYNPWGGWGPYPGWGVGFGFSGSVPIHRGHREEHHKVSPPGQNPRKAPPAAPGSAPDK